MAENAAHLSSAPQKNPSLFELIAQESLMTSLQASSKVLFDILRYRDNKYEWLSKWHEEIYLCCNCFLQYYYLKKCGGSFSEAFYNLRRVSSQDPSKLNLSSRENMKSMLILVALPYVIDKLKVYVDKWQAENQNLNTNSDKVKIIKTLINYYKYASMSYETIKLVKLFAYMAGKSTTHSPLLDIAGVRIVYQTDNSMKFPSFSWKDVLLSMFRTPPEDIDMKSILIKIFCQSLEFGAFFIQFMSWWHTDKNRAQMSSYPVPSAPHTRRNENSLKYNGLCPICMRKRRVEVVLQTSGYVFCYKCILDVINKTGKCPVTGLPSTTRDLIRVYDAVL